MSTKKVFTILILLSIALFTSYATIPAIPTISKRVRSDLPAFVWDSYVPSTFQDIANNSSIPFSGKGPSYISLDLQRSRVQAVYTGESRPVSEARTGLISDWFEANQADGIYKKMFANEWLFLADEKEYWLPVHAAASEYMTEDIQNGDSVTLLVVLLGVQRVNNRLDWLFIVNDVVPQ
jgi:hypothetical protein